MTNRNEIKFREVSECPAETAHWIRPDGSNGLRLLWIIQGCCAQKVVEVVVKFKSNINA